MIQSLRGTHKAWHGIGMIILAHAHLLAIDPAGLDAMPIQQPPSALDGAQASLAVRVQDRHFSASQPWPGKPSDTMFALTLPGTAPDQVSCRNP